MSLTVAAPSITDWMSGIGAVLGVIATIAVGVLTVRYTVKAVSRMRISATCDSAGQG
jgi:tellurite resistance protein TehA-like permease